MNKEARNLALLAVIICVVYAFFGQLVPQKRLDPPTAPVIRLGMATEELVEAGREIVHGSRGNCLVCHGFGESLGKRGPDLAFVGRDAARKVSGKSSEEYLMDSLIHPSLFVVPGYPDIMPSQNQPPTSLSGGELKAVVAYLQSLGGKVTAHVTEKDLIERKTLAATGPQEKMKMRRGRDLFWNMECPECHQVGKEGGGERSLAPNLDRIGAISPPDYIRISITKPGAGYVKGFEPGKVAEDMPLDYETRLSKEEIEDIVAYLTGLKGEEEAAPPLKDYSPWILLLVGLAVLLVERFRWGRPRA